MSFQKILSKETLIKFPHDHILCLPESNYDQAKISFCLNVVLLTIDKIDINQILYATQPRHGYTDFFL